MALINALPWEPRKYMYQEVPLKAFALVIMWEKKDKKRKKGRHLPTEAVEL